MSACPTPETLGRLACGPSNGPEFAIVEAHVQACACCQKALERLAAEASAASGRAVARWKGPDHPPAIPGLVIERELGRGAMGVVYQAWQPRLARRVAVKVVRASAETSAEDRRRWLREARAIGQARHPNVVRLHDAGEQEGCLYLIFDLVPGGSLADRLAGPLPPGTAAELIAAVARAVDQIHRAGILHLDIKPSNILLDGPPEGPWDRAAPMLADFGIARAGGAPGPIAGPTTNLNPNPTATATASEPIGLGGTPSFMAPEQMCGDPAAVGPRSDVYALGATLYNLLTGRPPFQAASAIETLDLARTREPAPPRALVPGLPRDLETIALTCLAKEPRRRYASAAALADDLRRWLDGFPIQARPASRMEHVQRWCRRRPGLASLAGGLVLTAALGLLGLLALWRHAEAERRRAENALDRVAAADRAMSGAVRNLADLLTTSIDAPRMRAAERLDKASRVLRGLAAELRQDRHAALSNLVAICGGGWKVAGALRARGRWPEARTLLLECLGGLDERRRAATSANVEDLYVLTLLELTLCEFNQGRLDAALVWARRAGEAVEGPLRGPLRLSTLSHLDTVRRTVAAELGRQGRDDERRRLLESHLRMLERPGASLENAPAIGFLAALVRSELAPDDGAAIARLRAAIQKFPADQRRSPLVEVGLGEWMARALNTYPPGPAPDGAPIMGRFDPEAHARSLLQTLEARCDALGVDRSLLPAMAFQVAITAAVRASRQRHAGLLEDARATVASLFALARGLARRCPEHPATHLLLSMAFEQESKIAWHADDRATIELALRRALDEARAALRLGPDEIGAQTTVASLLDKLVNLSPRPAAAPSPIPSPLR